MLLGMLGVSVATCALSVLQCTVCTAVEVVDLLHNNMLKYETYEQMLEYKNLHKREKRQAREGVSEHNVDLDDTDVFHGPQGRYRLHLLSNEKPNTGKRIGVASGNY